jgi:hypothetical protein
VGILSGENFVETVSLNECLESCPPKLFRKQHEFNLIAVQYRWKVTESTLLHVTYHYYYYYVVTNKYISLNTLHDIYLVALTVYLHNNYMTGQRDI